MFLRLTVFLSVLSLNLFSGFLLISPQTVFANPLNHQNIQITEVNATGSVGGNCKNDPSFANRCAFDKWVELKNISQEKVNISAYSLRFKDSSNHQNNVFLPSFVLEAGQYFLVGFSEKNFVSNLPVAPDYTHFNIKNLSNINEGANLDLIYQEKSLQKVILSAQNSDENQEKRSWEFINNRWVLSQSEFVSNNFGTPQNSAFKDISVAPIVSSLPPKDLATPPPVSNLPSDPEPVKTEPSPIPAENTQVVEVVQNLPEIATSPIVETQKILEKEAVTQKSPSNLAVSISEIKQTTPSQIEAAKPLPVATEGANLVPKPSQNVFVGPVSVVKNEVVSLPQNVMAEKPLISAQKIPVEIEKIQEVASTQINSAVPTEKEVLKFQLSEGYIISLVLVLIFSILKQTVSFGVSFKKTFFEDQIS